LKRLEAALEPGAGHALRGAGNQLPALCCSLFAAPWQAEMRGAGGGGGVLLGGRWGGGAAQQSHNLLSYLQHAQNEIPDHADVPDDLHPDRAGEVLHEATAGR
jgi:hypothetical protein